jgi:hypothetical protein
MTRLQQAGRGAASAVGIALAIGWFASLLFVEVGGVSYRKDCIRQDGTVSKSWTFTWFAPIPFLFRPSQEGCVVHTGARVALNAAGITKFSEVNVASAAREAAGDPALSPGRRYYAAMYAALKDLRDWNAAHPKDAAGGVVRLRQAADELDGLTAPSVVASDHAALIRLFRSTADTGQQVLAAVKANDRRTVQRLAPKLQSANARQEAVLNGINTKLVAAEKP